MAAIDTFVGRNEATDPKQDDAIRNKSASKKCGSSQMHPRKGSPKWETRSLYTSEEKQEKVRGKEAKAMKKVNGSPRMRAFI